MCGAWEMPSSLRSVSRFSWVVWEWWAGESLFVWERFGDEVNVVGLGWLGCV